MNFFNIFGTQAALFGTGLLIAGFLSDIKWTVLGQAMGVL